MKGVSFGGTSVFPNEEIINISQLNGVALVGGIGNFSKVDLGKALAGKRANVGAGIGNTTETVSGSCAPKDFETMMQLTYLPFDTPRNVRRFVELANPCMVFFIKYEFWQ